MNNLIFLLLVVLMPIFAFANDETELGSPRDVYRFECVPEVNHVAVELHRVNSYTYERPYPLEEKTVKQLEEQGLYFAGIRHVKGGEPRRHTCTIQGHTIEVEVRALFFEREQHGNYCVDSVEYTESTTWWLDGEKMVDDLRFRGGCTKQKTHVGKSFRKLKAHLLLGKRNILEGLYLETDRWELEPFKVLLSSKTPNALEENTFQAPLTNLDVHKIDVPPLDNSHVIGVREWLKKQDQLKE